jgi:hypothetical protein
MLKWITSLLTFENVANLASIGGFLITIFVYRSLRNIRREFLFRATLPTLFKSLQKHASSLSGYLQDFNSYAEAIDVELSTAEVNILNLHAKARGSLKKNLLVLSTEIKKYRDASSSRQRSKADVRSIYLKLNMVIQEISNLRADEKWG